MPTARTIMSPGTECVAEAVTIGADDDADEIFATMARHRVRRLPVIDGHSLIGMVTLADVARAMPDPQTGDLLEALSTD
nr:CBS domain-containing protein [Streptomyces sp. NRRL F-5135]